ncbi:Transmembrane protease serine 2 [Papilio machaon]|uniref:Transmembrane protease serine 2 n=1 Tax=Papilio machaon TaxID=76193 RepID=A0A0N1I9H6_PAPMA|nr:Transmembrane protease serine 2 [Papilio machaon]
MDGVHVLSFIGYVRAYTGLTRSYILRPPGTATSRGGADGSRSVPMSDNLSCASCTTNTEEAGVCRYFHDCEYAKNRVKRREKIKDCFHEDNKRYVCCVETTKITSVTINPLEQKSLGPIPEREVDKFLNEGLLQSNDIKCRFNGTFPVKCCRIVHDFTTLKFNEPPKCPVLEKPYARSNLSPHQSVIYDACYAYSRLGSKCLPKDIYDGYYRDDCHRFRSDVKISDGDPAKFKEFPHMANAHGVVKYALLGSIYKNDTRSGQLYHIVKIIKHPEYNPKTKKNDIALIKVHTRVVFSDFIRPACLTFPGSKENEYTACTVAGWGRIGERNDTSDVLLKATVYQEYNHSNCQKDLHQKSFVWDSTTMICAKSGKARPDQDPCKIASVTRVGGRKHNAICSYLRRNSKICVKSTRTWLWLTRT